MVFKLDTKYISPSSVLLDCLKQEQEERKNQPSDCHETSHLLQPILQSNDGINNLN